MIQRMRLTRSVEDNGVFLSLTAQYPLDDKVEIDLYRPSASPMEARLLRENLEKQLQEMFVRIRRRAYQQGWKDKASKKVAKQTWFTVYTGLTDEEMK